MPTDDTPHETPKPRCGEAHDGPPMAMVEELIDNILADKGGAMSVYYDHRMPDLRDALRQACRENAWDVVEEIFGMIAATGAEMIVRSLVALKRATDHYDRQNGSQRFPPVQDETERVQRVATFMLDSAERYAKISHVTHLARRKNDPKIVDFDVEREKMNRGGAEAGSNRQSTEAAEA